MSGVRQFEKFCAKSKSKHAKSALILLVRFFSQVPKPNKRRKSKEVRRITRRDASNVYLAYINGTPQHELAQKWGVNQARVNEIIKQKEYEQVDQILTQASRVNLLRQQYGRD